MGFCFLRTCAIAFLAFGVDSLMNQLNHQYRSQNSCFLDADQIKIFKCKEWDPAQNHIGTTVPENTICQSENGRNLCVLCEKGAWKATSCPKSRKKRSLWFIEKEITDCQLFCRRDQAGFDFTPPEFVSCQSPNSPVYADRGKTSSVVTWSQPQAKDRQGNVLEVKRIAGNWDSGDVFERGSHYIVYEATSENGLSSHCVITFEVTVIICPTPVLTNGIITCDNNNYMLGTTCRFSCTEGYATDGSAEITCQNNGQWSQTAPTCKRKSCPPLSNVFTCSEDFKYGSVCDLNCNYSVGLSPSKPSSTYCLSSGEWKIPLPSCMDTSPPVFKNCPLGNVIAYTDDMTTTKTVTYNDVIASDRHGNVTLTRVEGPSSGTELSVGETVVRFMAEDSSGNTAECAFNITVVATRCPRPPYNDSQLSYTCTNGAYESSTCSISCSNNYQLSGANSMTCRGDNSLLPTMSWDLPGGSVPSCQKASCPTLNSPSNGNLLCDSIGSLQFCAMSCNSGWDIPRNIKSHNSMFSCGNTGTWSPYQRVPDCTAKRTPSDMILKSQLYYYSSTCQTGDGGQLTADLMALINTTDIFSGTNCSTISSCSVKNVTYNCNSVNRRKRNAEQVKIFKDPAGIHSRYKRSETALVVTWYFSVQYDCSNRAVSQCVTYHEIALHELRDKVVSMVNQGTINSSLPGYQIRSDSYRYDYVTFNCGEGMLPVLNTGSCAVCPTGTMFNSTTESCVQCPAGNYQDTEHSFTCKPCPTGTTTISEGAWTETLCKDQCQQGWVSATGIQPCFPCPIGEYQSSVGSTTCEKCPFGTTTEESGSISSTDCSSFEFSVVGPAELQSVITTGSASDFSVVAWVKVRLLGVGFSISVGGNDFFMTVSQQVTVAVRGQIQITGGLLKLDTWTHIGVSFVSSTRSLSLFVSGQQTVATTIGNSSVISSASAMMAMSVGTGNEINLRSVQLLKRHMSPGEISTVSSTCSPTNEDDTIISLDNLRKTSGNVMIIASSSCYASDTCDPVTCNGHMCLNTPGSHTCHCQNGYTGSDCSVPPDFCINHLCQNEATCKTGASNYTCTCAAGYRGTLCESGIVNGGYSDWMSWSVCSVNCGTGNRTRRRTCNNPTPDPDGAPCSGPDVETQTCDSGSCSVCSVSQLQQSYASDSPECNGTVSELRCRPTCNVGYFSSRKQASLYACVEGFWSPSVRLPSCFKIVAPESASVTVQANYTKQGCPTEEEGKAIKLTLIQNLRTTQCQSNSDCSSNVVIPECLNTDPRTSVFSTFSIPLPNVQLDMENYVRTNVVSAGLAKVIEAINTLERTGRQLQDPTLGFLSATVNGTSFTPVYPVNITTDIVCPRGTFPEDGFCGECPPGTHYTDVSQSCVMCAKGTYQSKPGTLSCDRCPDGLTTRYTGSTLASDCSVESEDAPQRSVYTFTTPARGTTTKDIIQDSTFTDPTGGQNSMGVIIGCVVGALMLVIIILVLLLIKIKRKSKSVSKEPTYEQGFHFDVDKDYLTPTKDAENVYSEIVDPESIIPRNPYYHHIGNGRYLPSDPRPDSPVERQDDQDQYCSPERQDDQDQYCSPERQGDQDQYCSPERQDDQDQYCSPERQDDQDQYCSPVIPNEEVVEFWNVTLQKSSLSCHSDGQNGRGSYVSMVNNTKVDKPGEEKEKVVSSVHRESPIDPYTND